MKINVYILFLFLTHASTIFSVSKTTTQKDPQTPPCNLSSLGGDHPKTVCELRDFLLRYKESIKKEKSNEQEETTQSNSDSRKNKRLSILEHITNNILIWGKPGTGKSTAARSIAQDSNIEPQGYNARDLERMGKYELIEDKFVSRCHVIHWQMPDWQKRYDIIKHFTQIYPHTLSDDDVAWLASHTLGFVGRDIELAFENAFRIANARNENTFNKTIIFEAFDETRTKIDERAPQSLISKILFLRRIQAAFGY